MIDVLMYWYGRFLWQQKNRMYYSECYVGACGTEGISGYGRTNGSVFGVKAAALNLLTDWKEARLDDMKKSKQVQACIKRWSKPPVGWIKINLDAAIFPEGFIGVGIVIRDSHGDFVRAICSHIEGAWQPRDAEALSLKEALSSAKSLNLHHCIFETDSKTLVEACNMKHILILLFQIVSI